MLDLDFIKTSLSLEVDIIGRKENYTNFAVLLLLTEVEGNLHFVFEKRAKSIPQGGEVSFPGGEFERGVDESYRDTAIRETVEELGVDEEDLEILGRLGTLISPLGVAIEGFVGILRNCDVKKLKFNCEEVAEVFSVPLDFFINNEPKLYKVKVEIQPSYIDEEGKEKILLPARELGFPKRYSAPWSRISHGIYHYEYQHEKIWGITAHLIQEFVKRIKR